MAKCAAPYTGCLYVTFAAVVFFSGCIAQSHISLPGTVTAEAEAAIIKTAPGDGAVPPAASGEEEENGMAGAAAEADDAEEAGNGLREPEQEIAGESSLDAAMDLTQTAHEYWLDGDVDRSLEALDQAYGLIVQVDTGSDPKLIQQKEDLRFTISKRILELYASRYKAAKGTHKAIPLTINKYVEREIELFRNKERRFFVDAYRRSGRFRGEIVKALKEAGLPEELSWLPLIESGFKVRALSRSRALGLWQLIPSTGYKFGLARNAWIDERMDPAKSTAAAIAYLKELHAIFGDWATVLAAYNCGEGTVLRAIRKQKISYLDNFWDLYERLPNETARYYPRFLAVLAILKDPARYGMTLETPDPPSEFEVIPVRKQLHLRTLAKKAGVSLTELSALNPELRRQVTPAAVYSLRVPAGKGQTVLASVKTVPTWSAPKKRYVIHRVRRGETLWLLALRYRTSIRAIERWNKLGRHHMVRAGQALKIPLKGT